MVAVPDQRNKNVDFFFFSHLNVIRKAPLQYRPDVQYTSLNIEQILTATDSNLGTLTEQKADGSEKSWGITSELWWMMRDEWQERRQHSEP